jgi:hypothetical protein
VAHWQGEDGTVQYARGKYGTVGRSAAFVLRLEDLDYAGVPREQFMNSRINPLDSDFLRSSIDISELDLAWMIELD